MDWTLAPDFVPIMLLEAVGCAARTDAGPGQAVAVALLSGALF